MLSDTRFAVATHTLSVLAFMSDRDVSATFIGEQISIHPVIVRRTLALLGKSGLVTSTGGSKGGSRLSRSATKISLLDIYRAVHPLKAFEKAQGFPKSNCNEGRRVDKVLYRVYDEANGAIDKILAKRTLANILNEALK